MSRSEAEPMFITEVLGFHPQLLLDDIINGSNDAIHKSVDSLETFLEGWISAQEQKGVDVTEMRRELPQGMQGFETLLEEHADIAFDLMEAWSLRNVFTIRGNLPVVAPHHRGLDLNLPLGKDKELQVDVEGQRRKLEHLRKFYARLRRSEAQALNARRKAEARLQSIRFLDVTSGESEQTVPELAKFLDELRKLPTLPEPTGPNKPGHPSTSKAAYLNWAVEKLLKESAKQNPTEQHQQLFDKVSNIASPVTLQAALRDESMERDDDYQGEDDSMRVDS